jgi:hypothetical protein
MDLRANNRFMNKLLLFAAGAALFSSGIIWAQDSDPDLDNVPPPKPPFVARAPVKSAWIIGITPSSDGKGPSVPPLNPKLPTEYLKQQEWTKSGTLMRCVNEWSDGTKTEDWVVGPLKLSDGVHHDGIHLYNPRSDPRYHNFSTGDFEMLDWITPKDYVRPVKHGGEVCYLFTATNLDSSGVDYSGPHNKTLAQINEPASPTSVFISVQSGLPVEIDNGNAQYVFHFQPPPTDPLKLPEPFLVLWKAYRGH